MRNIKRGLPWLEGKDSEGFKGTFCEMEIFYIRTVVVVHGYVQICQYLLNCPLKKWVRFFVWKLHLSKTDLKKRAHSLGKKWRLLLTYKVVRRLRWETYMLESTWHSGKAYTDAGLNLNLANYYSHQLLNLEQIT